QSRAEGRSPDQGCRQPGFPEVYLDLLIGEVIQRARKVPIPTRVHLQSTDPKEPSVNHVNPEIPAPDKEARDLEHFVRSHNRYLVSRDDKRVAGSNHTPSAVDYRFFTECQLIARWLEIGLVKRFN